jgi:hypothetical protein
MGPVPENFSCLDNGLRDATFAGELLQEQRLTALRALRHHFSLQFDRGDADARHFFSETKRPRVSCSGPP